MPREKREGESKHIITFTIPDDAWKITREVVKGCYGYDVGPFVGRMLLLCAGLGGPIERYNYPTLEENLFRVFLDSRRDRVQQKQATGAEKAFQAAPRCRVIPFPGGEGA